MLFTIIVCVCSVIALFLCLFVWPTVKIGSRRFQTFYFGPLLGALLLLLANHLPFTSFWEALTAHDGINPLEILALFLSMSILSLALDEAGFFSYLAKKVAKRAGKSQLLLFVFLHFLASFLTIFTSNDIVILTLTPFIIAFAKEAKVSPKPYLVSEFIAANTWSMLLLIGNPTNIYLGVSFQIDFFAYLSVMALPTILAGFASFFMLLLIFHRFLALPLSSASEEEPLRDKTLSLVSLIILSLTIILMAVSSFISLPMWLISVGGAVLVLLVEAIVAVKKKSVRSLLGVLRRPPYAVVPFILSMFVLVLAMGKEGITVALANGFDSLNPYLGYGIGSFLASNLFNNIPTSVLFTSVIASSSLSRELLVYLAIISSNIGAYLTPIGALAGFMWEGIMKDHGEKFTVKDYLTTLTPVSLLSLGFAFLGLFIRF